MIEKENVRKYAIGPYSAYAIAVKHGFVGTEEDWLNQTQADRIKAEAALAEATKKATEAATSAKEARAAADASNAITGMDSTLSVKGAPADSKAVGDAVALKADKVSPHLFTIPITGWQTDDTVPGFTNYIDIAIDGMTDTDIVNVNVAPVSTTVAAKAQFTNTESITGALRLRARNVPETEITAQWYIVR